MVVWVPGGSRDAANPLNECERIGWWWLYIHSYISHTISYVFIYLFVYLSIYLSGSSLQPQSAFVKLRLGDARGDLRLIRKRRVGKV